MSAEEIPPTYWRDKYFAARREIVRLRERSESYWRDALVFRSEGDVAMAAAYETISAELRRTAENLGDGGVREASSSGDGAQS